MTKSSMIRFAAVCFFAASCLLVLPSCSGSDPEATAEQPQVDPRFATAEALLQYVRSLLDREAWQQDAEAFRCATYAETDAQRQFLELQREAGCPCYRLDSAVYERWGTDRKGTKTTGQIWPSTGLRLVEQDNQRAKAASTWTNGDVATLHLVRVGERWWVSGYSWEYGSDFTDSDRAELRGLSEDVKGVGAKIDALCKRVKSGEFSSADQVEDAYRQIMDAHLAKRATERARP